MLFPVRGGPSCSRCEPQPASCSMSRGASRVMTKCNALQNQTVLHIIATRHHCIMFCFWSHMRLIDLKFGLGISIPCALLGRRACLHRVPHHILTMILMFVFLYLCFLFHRKLYLSTVWRAPRTTMVDPKVSPKDWHSTNQFLDMPRACPP